MGAPSIAVLEAEDDLLVSAGTVAEPLAMADRRRVGVDMERLVDGQGFEVAGVTAVLVRPMAQDCRRWG